MSAFHVLKIHRGAFLQTRLRQRQELRIDVDDRRGGENDGPLDEVLQLTDIPGHGYWLSCLIDAGLNSSGGRFSLRR